MGNFVFFLFFIFFVLPILKGVFGGGKGAKGKKTPAQIRRELEAKMARSGQKVLNKQSNPWEVKNKHGHSGARQRTHKTMHSRDGDNDVFPEEHLEHVRKRDIRDRAERARMEKTIHRSENNAIRQTGNKSVDGWGVRGEKGGGGALVFLALAALAAYFVISNYFPDLLNSL